MDDGENFKKVKNPVVFVNHVDGYVGKNISKIFSGSVVGGYSDAVIDNESDDSGPSDGGKKEIFYKVVGTILNPEKNEKPAWVEEAFMYTKKEELLDHILDSDIIIYDIVSQPDQVDEATWVISALHAEIENFFSPKIFICLSSIMTWARTKPLDPEEPDIPFTEDDYRRRRAHPNFRPHISTEKLVIKLGKTAKTKLTSYVVASGLLYGAGEEIFHSLFKSAWHGNQAALQCYGNGQNIVPIIHIDDLASVLVNIADAPPKVRYLIAKDDSQSPLDEIVKCVSRNLGNGKVQYVSKEEALLIKDLQQTDFDMLLVNLRMDAGYVREGMRINWKGETGLIDSIESVIQEYKETRGLQPIRVCVLGPPSSGKTLVVRQLCESYKLHHIMIEEVINESVKKLEKSAARADNDGDEEDDVKAEEDRELLEALAENKDQNNGRYDDSYIIKFYKDKLLSMPCQNQGFILDGFPKTYEVAKELFQAEENDEDEDNEAVVKYNKLIMPEIVVSLDASDEFLKARIMNLPESVVAGTHNTEEGLLRRLAEFRAVNTEDETVLNYFDELEIHPDHIDITQDSSPLMSNVVQQIEKLIGDPRNYGPTPEELIEIKRMEVEKQLEKERKEKEERNRREREEANERAKKEEEWKMRLNEVKKEEQEVLETRSIPLRNYLMKHVMPTLSQGLVECTKIRPEDPVDFLAEYLFKNNPLID
ncbi:adenylate kinase 7-like [Xenia sp. Carnegie-2017]|uniref:adenylate kinase 7-like n=1 Tax=Xenia sp. Carnegie-2017 TaxID=2897299 RepID=UPI001F03CC4C|nr:adenylate kinase 7-like [Xenia sp. Carnegie-2017]XP_046849861.1 adenylate kinase 7-like [Xenia sp. Carnegie-2017]